MCAWSVDGLERILERREEDGRAGTREAVFTVSRLGEKFGVEGLEAPGAEGAEEAR
jgi:hypothetical protein